MNKPTFLALLFISEVAFGQNDKRFNDFVKLFPATDLPVTIQYAHNEFDYQYYTPEISDIEGDEVESNSTNNLSKDTTTIQYANSVLCKPDSLIIQYDFVQLYILADSETATLKGPDSDPLDTIYPTYYISLRLKTNKAYICLIYETQYTFANHPAAEKHLCTLTNSGKLIDKILVASANYSGTGMLTDDFRVPWFPEIESQINNDLTLNFKTIGGDYINYKIDNKGRIKRQRI